MISRILMSLLTMLVATSMYAQVNTYYVRAGGDDNNDGMTPGTAKATIQGVANLPLQYGDVIDIGAGDFAGAALPPVDLTILGVNAYTPWDQWGNDATVITAPFVLNAGGAYAFEGLTFAPYIAPLQYDAYWGYPYSIALSNCLFDRTQQLYIYGSTITTIASNRFVGDNEYNGGSGVYVSDNYGSVVIGENTFDGCNTGVVIYGSIEHAIVSYNDFRRCYTGINSYIWNSTDGVEIRNNIFAGGDDVNLYGVTISASGNQPFHVTENSFGRSTTGYALAIANWSSTLVPATCNYFGTADAGLIVGANYGNLELGPYNAVGTDIDDGAVGFIPDPNEACATEGPVKTSTDYSRSFFSIQAAIDASADGAIVRVQKGTYPGGITVTKNLTIIGSHEPFMKDGNGNWVWNYDASDARAKSADASAWTVIDGAINVTAGAGDVTLNAVTIRADVASKPINVSATRSMSLSNSRIDAMTCGTGVPTQSAITLNRGASLNVHQSVIDVQKWDPGCDDQRIRALTCAIGNLSRSISITNSNIEGSLEFRGLSSTSVVTVSGNKISNAGADGIALIGNTIRTYTIENNEITDANNHGIAFRNAGSYGTALKVNNNLVQGSGAGSANQAGIFFSAAATGTINSIGNNSLVSANAIGLLNDGTKTIPMSCQWWGSTSGNVITTKVSGNATVENWLVDGADNSTATGFQPKDGVCTGTFVKLNLVAKVDIKCNGAATGSIDMNLTGGTAPYTHAWTGPNGYTGNTLDIASLKAGTYNLKSTDKNGTYAEFTVTLTEPTLLVVESATVTSNFNGSQLSCNGAMDGQISMTAMGGVPPYKYSRDNGVTWQDASVFNGLGAATHAMRAKDANDCVTPATNVTITAPPALQITSAPKKSYNGSDLSCNGAADGEITVNATGGTGAKEYSKDNGATYQASNVFGSLAAGTYQMRVRDVNACTTSVTTVTITAPPVLSITSATKKSYNGSDLSCNGATDGQITVSATGGTGTLQYSRDNGSTYQASNVFGSLAAGTYQIRVKDVNNCVTSATSVTITAPPALSITGATKKSYNGSDLSCNGAADGEITVTATGGTGAKQYSKDNGSTYQASNVFGTLAAGTYQIRVRDDNGCTTLATSVTITAPPALSITGTSKKSYNGSDLSCNGAADGEITVTATGGTGTKQYSKDNGSTYQASNVFGSLAAGTYQIRVKDANNCVTSATSVTITAPAALSITSATKKSYNGSDLSCNGAADGEITVTATGGTGAVQYSKDNGSTYQASNVFGTLAAGTYQIRVKDANNCVTSATSVTITAPPALSIASATKKSYNGSDLSCNGAADGEITVTATGGTGTKQYSKDNGSTYQASNVFGSLAAGTYQIRVKDVNNCVTSATSVTITAPPALAITSAVKKSYNGSDLSCPQTPDGQITVTATGGTGNKEYSKDNGSTYQASNVFMGLGAGTYQIRVKDANNCVTSATSVTITAPPALTITSATKKTYNGSDLSCNGAADGEITVTATGGTGTKQYSKDNGSTYQASNIFSNLAAGTYQIFVKDANNCTTTTSVTITAPPALTVQSAVKKSYNGSDVSCAGATDGQITVTPAGGTGTVQYSKDNGVSYQASNIFAGLAPATYDIRVKDANGCVSPSVSVTIKATQALSATASKKSYNGADVSCATSADGEITVTAGGGTGTLEFSKDGGNTYQASNVFSNLAPGTYAIRVRDVNECAITTNVTLVAPPALTASIASISPKKTGESLTFTSTVGGGTGAYTYKWTTTALAFADPGNVGSWTINSGVEDNSGTYTLSVKDANGCEVTATVDVIVYGTTVWVNAASGNDNNRGNAALPLKTIQKGIDVTNSGNTINVAGGVYSESPTLTSARTIQGTDSPELGSNTYFIYSTADSVTINGFVSATFNTMGAGSVDGIYKALNKLNANGTLRVQSGTYTISSTINIYSGVTVKGADVDMSGTCLLDPASAIVGSGTGLVLFKFHGSAAKTVSDIKLQIGNTTGRIFEIVSGSGGNVSTERVLFANESGIPLYGLMNLDRSGGVVNDVAKLVNDKNDFGYGTGEVLYGNYAPLPASAVAAAWKGEDANTATQAANVSTLSAYVGTNLVNASVLTSKPKFYSGDANILNGRAHLRFDGSDFLDASTSAAVNGGDEKSVFVAFRTGAATAEDMVVYKHGDEDQGVSVIVDSDENIELNIYEDGEVETLSYAAAANTEYIAQIYFNGTSANADATDPRVGLAIDKVDGQAAEAKIVGGATGFDKTTLTTPLIGTASKISMGGRVGSVYIDGAEVIGTTRGNYFNGNIGEVIVLNTSAKATRDAVYCYLRNKYFDGDNQGYDNDLERRDNVIAGEEVADASLLSAFPNPADAEFTIEAYITSAGNVTVTLHDAIGRNVMTVFEGTVGSKATLPLTASVRDLPTGAYTLHMTGPNGLHMVTPIIVRH